MKRIFLTVLSLLCVAVLSFADTVSLSRATAAAREFLAANGTRSTQVGLTMVWDGTDTATRTSGEPAFYVFNCDGGGFVVISAEDAARPVLAFSETGSFTTESMPDNIRAWFEGYGRQVEYLRSAKVQAPSEAAELWNGISRSGLCSASTVNLNTPTWSQEAPFNNLCPMVDNQQSYTGCVCTSICEVMHHHRWPAKGQGTLPSYTYKTDKGRSRTQAGHTLTATYDWDKMPSKFSVKYTSEQATQVARLMFDVAVMIQSQFNGMDGKYTFGTAAYDRDVIPAMVSYMDYDSSAVLLFRDQYSDARWAEMLRSELDAGRPMIYDGDGNSGGHCFVVDGYKSDDYFYINWGWSGLNNGWFALSSFVVAGYDFLYGQGCVFGLRKNEGGRSTNQLALYSDNGSGGLTLASGTVGTSTFQMNVDVIYNFGSFNYEGRLAFVLMDRNDTVKEVISGDVKISLEPLYGTRGKVSCTLSEAAAAGLQLGDKIVLCRIGEDGSLVKVPLDGSCTGVDEYAVFDIPFIDVNADATYEAGGLLPLKIINYNKIPTSFKWYVDGMYHDDEDLILTTGKHVLKCVAAFSDRTETIVQEITVR